MAATKSSLLKASNQRRTISTFSCDIARAVSRYSRSPAASRAVCRFVKPGRPRNLAVAERPQRRLAALDLDAATSPTSPGTAIRTAT